MALEVSTIIERCRLFRGLPQSTITELASLSSRRAVPPKAVVFTQGQPGDALFGVIKGRVRISSSTAAGKEMILNILEPGEVFGEIALLDGHPRTATAVAVTPTELFSITRQVFLGLLARRAELAQHLLMLLCERIRWSSGIAEDLALLDVPARVARRLVCLTKDRLSAAGTPPELLISQQELANFLGLSRQIVNQHLQVWKERQWIILGRGKLQIKDMRAMRKVAAEG
jgi:CRP/FNR family cyclic AMP-dependent transcriptional regulator